MEDRSLSVTIITKNEEGNIGSCLESVAWADEIVVVDSGSTDSTESICRSFPNCRFLESEWLGFGATKALAVERASNNWVLSLDADEIVTPGLAEEIRGVTGNSGVQGYRIPRRSFYLGRVIRHCGWRNDMPLRLFRRDNGQFNKRPVHESVELNGVTGTLKNHLLHHSYPTVESHLQKMNRYSTLAAEEMKKRGRNATIPGALFRGFFRFLRMYLFQAGFLDGREGFLLCYNSSSGVFWKYVKLWKLNRE